MRNHIKSRVKAAEALWDWGMFDGCFGKSKIAASDIDGVIERKHHFLFIEGKPLMSNGRIVPLKRGQKLTYERLSMKPDCTVLLLWGEPSQPGKMQDIVGGAYSKLVDCTVEDVREFVSNWYERAENNGRIA